VSHYRALTFNSRIEGHHCLLSSQQYLELEREIVLNNGAGTGYPEPDDQGLDVRDA